MWPCKAAKPFTPVQFRAWPPRLSEIQPHCVNIKSTMSTPLLVRDCPRCYAASMTFDVLESIPRTRHYDWQARYEVFCRCRNCQLGTVFVIQQKADTDERYAAQPPTAASGSLNQYYDVEGFICLKDMGAQSAPEHVPQPIANAFHEATSSVVTGCPNAAAAMFRLAIDLATRPLLPADENSGRPNAKVCRDLGLRLPWLLEKGLLPRELQDLSRCIREDGNDGAHAGTLTLEDALDLQDFTTALLERMFTEPARLKAAAERREKRRRER
jgi:hypothetical protein